MRNLILASIAAVGVVGGIVALALFLKKEPTASPISRPIPEVTQRPSEPEHRSDPRPVPIVERTAEEVSVPAPIIAYAAALADPPEYTQALSGLRGRLIESDGSPVVGMRVELFHLQFEMMTVSLTNLAQGDASPPFELVVGADRTDEQGRFALGGVPPIGFHALGIDPGGPRSTARVVDHDFESGLETDLGDIVLDPFVTFVGRIVDESGAPVAGARVRATTLSRVLILDGLQNVRAQTQVIVTERAPFTGVIEIPPRFAALEPKLPIPTTTSGADGRFLLAGVPQGLATLAVDLPGTAGSIVGPRPTGKRPETDLGDVSLRSGRTAVGKVVDLRGSPVPGCEVLLATQLSIPVVALGESVHADANGAFRVPGLLPAGEVLAAVRVGPGNTWQVSGPHADLDRLQLVLDANYSVDLRLADVEGKPIDDASLQLRATAKGDLSDLSAFQTPVDVRPRAEKVGAGHLRLGGLAAGDYELMATAEGYAIASTRFVVPAPEPVTVQFSLAAAASVQVLDELTQLPIVGAHVSACGDRRGGDFMEIERERTDTEGRAGFTRIPRAAESLSFRFDHPAYVPMVVPLDEAAYDSGQVVLLSVGGGVHGSLRNSGGPLAEPAFLMITHSNWSQQRHPNAEIPRFLVPAGNGEFAASRLLAGEWEYNVFPRFLNADPLHLFGDILPNGPKTLLHGGFDVEVGKVTEITIDLDPAMRGAVCSIRGRIRSSLPPGTRYQVSAQPTSQTENKEQEVGAGDWFELTELTPEPHEFWVRIAGENSWQQPVHYERVNLLPEEQRTLEVSIEAAEFSLSVVDRSGRPVVDTQVQLFPLDANGDTGRNWQMQTSGTSDAKGEVTLLVPKPGKYRITAENEIAGIAGVDADLPGDSVQLVLDPGTPCAGVVAGKGSNTGATEGFRAFSFRSLDHPEIQRWMNLPTEGDEFRVVGLVPGRYVVECYRWTDGGQENYQTEFVLPVGGNEHLRLEFQ